MESLFHHLMTSQMQVSTLTHPHYSHLHIRDSKNRLSHIKLKGMLGLFSRSKLSSNQHPTETQAQMTMRKEEVRTAKQLMDERKARRKGDHGNSGTRGKNENSDDTLIVLHENIMLVGGMCTYGTRRTCCHQKMFHIIVM